MEPLQSSNPEGEPATAARVAASARASLAALQSFDEDAGTSCRPLLNPVDSEAWSVWVEHYQASHSESRAAAGMDGDGVSYDLRSVSYRLTDKRKLLQDLTFAVPAGSSVAIMGASGSGKTTLLSVLSGRCGDGCFEGEMRVSGVPVLPWQLAQLRPLIGYVPQDDVMQTALSVRENLRFEAELRWPQPDSDPAPGGTEDLSALDGASEGALNAHVDAVIGGLGLAHMAGRRIATGVSGGQRKRTSIGMELVSKPRVLLLDEPSTGLDASTAHRIIEMVLASTGAEACTTFSTIHQPRWATLGLFDMVVLLAPGGHLCFAGPVSAVKAYFSEVLRVEFPVDENPADVIIDACTFESARKMATDGLWKNPPQCLRAVLIPTPEVVVSEERQSHWQQEEFGQMLAALWKSFSSACRRAACAPSTSEWGEPEAQRLVLQPLDAEFACTSHPLSRTRQQAAKFDSRLVREARRRAETCHWAHQVWLQMMRTFVIMDRALWPAIVANVGLTMLTLLALTLPFPRIDLLHVIFKTGLMFLLLSLTQSVAAQRIFGGDERHVASREASVCSLAQVFCGFVGKDLASLLEIMLAAVCFTLTYWPDAHTFASAFDIFAIGFACIYCVWGMAHIWAVILPPQPAIVVSVVASFLSFLFSGDRPSAFILSRSFGGYGKLLLLASPIRWGMSHFLLWHVIGHGSTYWAEALGASRMFRGRGYDLHSAKCPADPSLSVMERWRQWQGFVCHNGQLFLLGFLFRFVAVVCQLLLHSAAATGGQLSLGVSSRSASRLLRDALLAFLVASVLLQVLLLGETH